MRKTFFRRNTDVFQGKMVQRSVKRSAVRVRWEFSDTPYNLNCYYNSLKALLAHMIEAGLSSKERQEGIYFAESLDEIKRILHLA